jgi:cobalt transporter subunit CbtB
MTKAIAAVRAAGHAHTDLMPIAFAAILGFGLIFVAGFSQASVLHDTAHDARHAMAFPCH